MESSMSCIFLLFCVGLAGAFLQDGGFDPNAINGFGSGQFDPNAGQGSTIPPPSPDNGGSSGTGGGFDPNSGGFGSWGSGGFGQDTPAPTAGAGNNFGNNIWGVGTGAGGFNPNVGYTTSAPPSVNAQSGSLWDFSGGNGATAAPTQPPTTMLPTTSKPQNPTTGMFWEFGGDLSSGGKSSGSQDSIVG